MFSYIRIVIFSLFIAVIFGDGDFSVLLSPSSIEFTGNDQLESSYIGDVLLAALGNSVIGSIPWNGMTIKDPFSLAKTSLIIIQVRGIYHLPTPNDTSTYEFIGSDAESSLDYLVSQLSVAYDINFVNHKKGVGQFLSCFGSIDAPIVQPIEYLQPHQYWSHKHFLEELGLIKHASQHLELVLKPSHALIFRLSLDRIVKVPRYAPINEAKALIAATVQNLMDAIRERNDSVLLVQISNKHSSQLQAKTHSRVRGSVNPFQKIIKDLNFPIIANLALWFSLAFVISVTVICYAIATIDPGRDSVIYRVSSVKDFTKKKH
ncbi:ATPase H(+)-transporting accessory protein 2-like [Drosophila innubila]|uniref:ATPase H(+)-transporting accessory protein 2-like n=1 Tax=Drosophila innubila TaxID=198719 RepID=UPI00148CEE08|nr:ATPase H(+)-transporting accessory protein 2-like [Drosophila innubila]